jgi:hypothetical protein
MRDASEQLRDEAGFWEERLGRAAFPPDVLLAVDCLADCLMRLLGLDD